MSDPLRQELLGIFVGRATRRYGLSAINQLQHALQAAALAEADDAPPATVLASLLHDVGHMVHDLGEDPAGRGIDDRHEELGARWLADRFGPDVSEPVRLHVAAKRYLCAVEPDYFGKLSPDSVRSLGLQGGPMSADEIETFRRHPQHAEAVRLRRYDEAAKDPRASTPDFDHFLRHIETLQTHEASSMMERRDVEAAWDRIRPYVRRTPAVELKAGAFGIAAPLALKLEQMQVSGSFKGRGAFHKLLASKVPPAGVIAASGGNHGAAVAYAARALGYKAEIFVPTIASPAKVARLKSYGAAVHQIGAVYAEARAASEKRAAETGALTVPAYEDPVVFAGAGTVALEFTEQATFDTLLVAVGGGGLIAGCAVAIGAVTKIVAVETEGTPTLYEARRAGRPVEVKISGIAADALGASRIGTPNFEVAQKLVREAVLVSDEAVRSAQRALWDDLRLIAEPAGATGLAALMAGAYNPAPGERIGVLICGANTELASVA